MPVFEMDGPEKVARDHFQSATNRFITAEVLFDMGDHAAVMLEATQILDLVALGSRLRERNNLVTGYEIMSGRTVDNVGYTKMMDEGRASAESLASYLPGTVSPNSFWTKEDARAALTKALDFAIGIISKYEPEMVVALQARLDDLAAERRNVAVLEQEKVIRKDRERVYDYSDAPAPTPFAATSW